MSLEKHTLVVGPFQCNCSILVCTKSKEAIVIDAGDEFERIQNQCKKLGVHLKYSVHTHAHLDHIGAVGPLKAWSPQTQIALHKADEQIYHNLQMQGRMFGIEYDAPPAVDVFLEHEQVVAFGHQEFKVIHTPGHSPGGVCLHFKEGALADTPVLFSGDTLFQQSVGRSDLWGGDHHQLVRSIKERLLSLDDETIVHPGHGASTSVAIEAHSNPFL